MVLLFGVNLAMAVWLQNFTDAKANSAGISSAADPSSPESASNSETAQ
jgi:hypothetical protein